jgi:uncharacterized phage-associated protein
MLDIMAVAFEYDFENALAAMVYIAAKEPRSLDVYKICKLVFLADKLHLVQHGRTITGDQICAMEYGPVPSNTYRVLSRLISETPGDSRVDVLSSHLNIDRSFSYPRISERKDAPIKFDEFLSRSDMRALDEVISLHGAKSFDELKALTHEMPSYKRAWHPERSANNPTMLYEDLFEEDSDALRGTLEEMIENDELRKAFGSTEISSQ